MGHRRFIPNHRSGMKTSPVHIALERRLEPLIRAERNRRAFKVQIWVWLIAAGVAALLLALILRHQVASSFWALKDAIIVVGMLVMIGIWRWSRVDVHAIAREVEAAHPELRGALLAALEQEPGPDGSLGYLQERVIDQVVKHGVANDWAARTLLPKARRIMFGALAACAVFLGVSIWGTYLIHPQRSVAAAPVAPAPVSPPSAVVIEVAPGDAEVERGSRLIVEAKFPARVPADATIIVSDPTSHEEIARYPLKPTVDLHVFGGMIPDIKADALYRVDFGEGKSDDYKLSTFVHPALLRADAKVTPPAYTGLPPKEIKNTRNVSALEGSEVAFRITVNKPVAEAELFGEDKSSIPLKPSAADPLVLEATMKPDATQKYRVHLVDDHDRANKQPPWIKVAVQKNLPPKIDIQFPKRDIAVSPIQELPVEAKVWDDVGVQKIGAVFSLAGVKKEVSLGDTALAGGKPHQVKSLLELEQMKAKPKQLVSYYLWAEDYGADGKIRRTLSDMFFAEVRHFEDIFRERESPPGEDADEDEGKGQTDELVKLQKDVLNATWRLIRDTGAGRGFDAVKGDIDVVHQGQDTAKEKTDAMIEKVKDAEIGSALRDASKAMQAASGSLSSTLESGKSDGLTPSLDHEREALEALYRAQTREHSVMKAKSSKSSKAKQSADKQLMQLELKQKDQRYEETKEAKEEKTKEQQENLQVLNRLKELARRQEALAEKIKELETQLQQAKTEQEKNEVQRQLKRLQEEQEQLLRDLDELKDRMEKPENQPAMAEERAKIDQAREKLSDAADKLKEQQLAAAANAATRAQRELEEARDDFRKRTSKRFGEEMKQLKQQARDLATNEEKLSEALEENGPKPSNPNNESSDAALKRSLDGARLNREMADQRKKLNEVIEEMKRVSESAEEAEPLLSGALYDAVRKAQSTDVDKALEEAGTLAQYGQLTRAQSSERKAAKGIDDLKNGIDKAAEGVLGSETEALRMARAELDRLMKDVDEAGAEKGKPGDTEKGQQAAADGKKGDAEKPGDTKGEAAGDKPSKEAKLAGAAGQEKGQAGEPKPEGKGASPANGDKGDKGEKSPDAAGEGSESKESKMAAAGDQGKPGAPKGDASGKGGAKGKGEAKSPDAKGELADNPTDGKGGASGTKGEGKEGEGQPAGSQPGQPQAGGQQPGRNVASAGAANGGGGDSGGPTTGEDRRGRLLPSGRSGWFFEEGAAPTAQANDPLTGEGFGEWSDRLRRVEEALDDPQLRNRVARVQDNAREMRIDFRRNNAPPQALTVRTRITEPLAELRERVSEELAKREGKDAATPLDRDPVPGRFRELVRRYYSELGTGR